MKRFSIEFPDHDITIEAKLLEERAPKTCEAFWGIIEKPLHLTGKHAMYTGPEISVQLPKELCESTNLEKFPPENQTCFPSPGDLLFTFVPEFAWKGIPQAVYDLGCFYGPEARTLFPMGWLAGNRFATVEYKDLEKIAQIGSKVLLEGQQKLTIRRLD
mgnify:CR=1 FL=1